MEELTNKQINLIKIKKVKDYLDYIQKEVENELEPNKQLLDETIELLIEVKGSIKNGK